MVGEWLEIRLYLDEDISHDLAVALRREGYDVIGAIGAGNIGLSDEEQLEFASAQGRAILTFNIGDFARRFTEWQLQEKEHYGIIVSQQFSKQEFGELLRRILRLLDTFAADEVYNNFLYLSA
jgi:predicted nuclease of predicted toxin-antitoxin system